MTWLKMFRHVSVLAARMRGAGIWCWAFVWSLGFGLGCFGAAPVVPNGFAIERAAPTNALRFPMFAAFDERGRLFVAESSGKDLYAELQKLTRECRVSMLEDVDGEGRFEKSRVFVDKLVFPMGLAWRDGKLYVADPPDLVALSDTDGDGRADKREMLLTGFGHQDNGSLHGLTFGPDGWLYMTLGQPDGYNLKRADGSMLTGKSGALLRCRADGSGVEVFCRGFENLVEVVFLPSGEIIGTDNWFYFPAQGVRDALVHLVEGGLYPMKLRDEGTPQFSSGDPLPPLAVYPAVALSGLALYRGVSFPAAMRGNFFSAQFNTRKVVRHELKRSGSTFQSTDEDFVTTDDPDFHPSDVLEDADGSLLVVDTGSWYVHHCPTGRIRNAPAEGGIYRVRRESAKTISDPRGLKLNWNAAADQLAKRLSDERPAVRDRAAEALVQLGSSAVKAAEGELASGSAVAREHAVWILQQIDTPQARASLRAVLKSEAPDLVALVARALGRSGDKLAEPQLIPLLKHSAPHVRLAAAEALAHCGSSRAASALIAALTAETDVFIEHALSFALHHFATDAELLAALEHSHPRVQKAALVLLDQFPRYELSADSARARLFSTDAGLRRAAQAAFRRHGDWLRQAITGLRDLLARPSFTESERETVRDVLLAFQSSDEVVALMAAKVSDQSSSVETHGILLEVMSSVVREKIPASWSEALRGALRDSAGSIKAQAVRVAYAHRIAGVDAELRAIAQSQQNNASLRMEAVRALVRQQPALDAPPFDFLLSQVQRTNVAALRLSAAEVLAGARLSEAQLAQFASAVHADSMISPHTLISAAQRSQIGAQSATALLESIRESVRNGAQLSEEQVKWLRASAPQEFKNDVDSLVRTMTSAHAQQQAHLAEMQPLLTGGDPNRGQGLFIGKAGCTSCHRVGKTGGIVGPDLTRIGVIRAARDLMESLVVPSATFAQGYESFIVDLKNGDTLTGVRVRQPDDSFVLRDASGADVRLDMGRIDKIERSNVSLMPEGLLAPLSHDEIRDLLAYLQNLK